MTEIEFFVPPGYRNWGGCIDGEFMDFCLPLVYGHPDWLPVPGTVLQVRVVRYAQGVVMEAMKQGRLVYGNFLCLDREQSLPLFAHVQQMYRDVGFGVPEMPTVFAWVHSIPLGEELVEEGETWTIQKLAVTLLAILVSTRDLALAGRN